MRVRNRQKYYQRLMLSCTSNNADLARVQQLYAPNYTPAAEKDIYKAIGGYLGPVYVARTQDELEIRLTELQAAQGG